MMKETVKGKIILFVDDDEISNFVSVRTLEDANIAEKIVSVTSAMEALDLIKEGIAENKNEIPDLIFLDINMPVMTGWDFLDEFEKIKSDINKNIIIIILTSSVYQQDKEKAATYTEVNDYTLKPLSTSDLMVFKEKYLD